MKRKDSTEEQADKMLAGLIAAMDDARPPKNLVNGVMQRIRPKRLSRWQRLRLHMKAPLAVISIRPMLAGAATFAFIILLITGKMVWLPEVKTTNGCNTTVNFRLDWPTARNVSVIGTFNHWQSEGYRMQRNSADNTWYLAIEMPPGQYAYAFVIDDQRVVPDPYALWSQDDGFGGSSSIVTVDNGCSNENRI